MQYIRSARCYSDGLLTTIKDHCGSISECRSRIHSGEMAKFHPGSANNRLSLKTTDGWAAVNQKKDTEGGSMGHTVGTDALYPSDLVSSLSRQ